MKFTGTLQLSASRNEVWVFLHDPHLLSQCVPGLEEVEIFDSERGFSGNARLPFGSRGVRVPVQVTWVEQEAPGKGTLRAITTFSNYDIEGEGTFELDEQLEGGTGLTWTVAVTIPEQLGGNQMLAQMARGFAARFIKRFFECIEVRLSAFDIKN